MLAYGLGDARGRVPAIPRITCLTAARIRHRRRVRAALLVGPPPVAADATPAGVLERPASAAIG